MVFWRTRAKDMSGWIWMNSFNYQKINWQDSDKFLIYSFLISIRFITIYIWVFDNHIKLIPLSFSFIENKKQIVLSTTRDLPSLPYHITRHIWVQQHKVMLVIVEVCLSMVVTPNKFSQLRCKEKINDFVSICYNDMIFLY